MNLLLYCIIIIVIYIIFSMNYLYEKFTSIINISGGYVQTEYKFKIARSHLYSIFANKPEDLVFAIAYEDLKSVNTNTYKNKDAISLMGDLTGKYILVISDKKIGFNIKQNSSEDIFKVHYEEYRQKALSVSEANPKSISKCFEEFKIMLKEKTEQYASITKAKGVVCVPDEMSKPKSMMSKLKKFYKEHEPVIILKRNYTTDYMLSDGLSCHYSGVDRMKSRKKDSISPIEAWVKYKDSIINYATYGDNFYESLYNHVKICNTFNPTIMINCAKHYFGTKQLKILDPSVGWSDRLVSSIAMNCEEYVGFDPNTELETGFNKLVEDLGNTKYTFIPEPFTFKPEYEEYFDFVFSSSPFYDIEIYNNGKQSIEGTNSYEDWITKFYEPYLKDAFKCLKKGGLIGFYIENLGKLTMGDDTVKILKSVNAKPYNVFEFIQTEDSCTGRHTEGKPRTLYTFTK